MYNRVEYIVNSANINERFLVDSCGVVVTWHLASSILMEHVRLD